MANYKSIGDYDSSYKVNNRQIACYSKSKMKKLYPDGNYTVTGETVQGNKKEQIDTVVFGNKRYKISAENSHSRLLYRTVGYVECDNGEYIALLKNNLIFLWLILGVLLIAGISLAIILSPPEKDIPAPLPSTLRRKL